MLTYQKLINKPKTLKRFSGFSPDQFTTVVANLLPHWELAEQIRLSRAPRKRAIGAGHPYRLRTLGDKLLVLLFWYRTNTLFEVMGWMFGLDGTNIGRLIRKLTPLLEMAVDPGLATILDRARRKRKKIKSWEAFMKEFPDLAEVIIDATEQRRKRPGGKRAQKKGYSGKKHAHTIKTQITVSGHGRIMDVSDSYPGRIHDKTILVKEKTLEKLPRQTRKRMDKGYDGITNAHPRCNIILPHKRRRGSPPLSRGQKRANTLRSKARILVENTIARLKKYRILEDKYRGNEREYNQHVRNIAALCNFRLLYATM